MKDYVIADVYDNEYDEIYYLILGLDSLLLKLTETWQVELYHRSYESLQSILLQSFQKGRYSITEIRSLLYILDKNYKQP
jgi:hypothetical protein